MRYTLRTDMIYDENDKMLTVYGISAVDVEHNILKSVPDIFTDKLKAEQFIDLCNRKKLSIVHLEDVIKDVIAAT